MDPNSIGDAQQRPDDANSNDNIQPRPEYLLNPFGFLPCFQGSVDGRFQGHGYGVPNNPQLPASALALSVPQGAYQQQYHPGPPAWNAAHLHMMGFGSLPVGVPPGYMWPAAYHASGSSQQQLSNLASSSTALSSTALSSTALAPGFGNWGGSFADPAHMQPLAKRPVIAVGTTLPVRAQQGGYGHAHVGRGISQAAAQSSRGPWMNAPNPQVSRPHEVPSIPPSAAMDTLCPQDEEFLQFGSKLLRTKCPKCDTQTIHKEESLYRQAASIASATTAHATTPDDGVPSTVAPSSCCVPCPECNASVCIGCGRSKDEIMAKTTSPSAPGRCCDEGRLPVIWVLLCAVASKKRRQQVATRNKTAPSDPRPRGRGIGYDEGPPWGKHTKLRQQEAFPGLNAKEWERSVRDGELKGYFDALARALPGLPDGSAPSSPFDQHPPPLVSAMVRRSLLMTEVAEMLRNDSIKDIVSRAGVYESLFRLVRQLQTHPDLAVLVYGKRYDYPFARSLLYATFPSETPVPARKPEAVQPLAPLLRTLGKLARCMLQRVSKNLGAYSSDEAGKTLRLCEQMCSLADLAAAHDGAGDGDVQTGGTPEPNKLDALGAWHKEHAVAEMDDEAILSNHVLRAEAQCMAQQVTKPGRMKKLIDEVMILTSSLPSGIYVRHGSSRLDVMKVLIEGPQGTPYEFGLFEFDLLCTHEYPKRPPLVHFRSKTSEVINPNIYSDGICLSLLGTWRGEPWNLQLSTLLQLLVSLQSMVLCEEPWCNEPGRERDRGSAVSKKYTMAVRETVLAHYTQPWVFSPEGIWAEVMKRHLAAKAGEMLKSAEVWFQAARVPSRTRLPESSTRVDMAGLRTVLGGMT